MNGVINFLKPPGMSSNGAVVFLRGLLGVKKTGHAGTLDPGACGVLPICVGKATRISSYLMGEEKEYIAEVSFGKATDTGDSYGTITSISDAPLPYEAKVREVLSGFVGQLTQQTPAYSAVKHEGQKLYKLARKGMEVPALLRDIVVYDVEYLRQTRENAHLLRFACGKGTYIRVLCEDLGRALGTVSYMSLLVRTRCAGLDIAEAYTADALKDLDGDFQNVLMPADKFLGSFDRIDAPEKCHRFLLHGASFPFEHDNVQQARVYVGDTFLGIGSVQDNMLKISTLLVDN